jgi:hypothetical protein
MSDVGARCIYRWAIFIERMKAVLLALIVYASTVDAQQQQMLCNICHSQRPCCLAVVNSAGGSASCMADSVTQLSFALNDGKGGMSFTHSGCFSTPAVGSINFPSGGKAYGYLAAHEPGNWGDDISISKTADDKQIICRGGQCCIVNGISGSCYVDHRAYSLQNLGTQSSHCPLGELRMTDDYGNYASACLDRRGGQYVVYWAVACHDVKDVTLTVNCKEFKREEEGATAAN